MPTNPRTDPTRLHATTQKKTQENPVQLILGHYTRLTRMNTVKAGISSAPTEPLQQKTKRLLDEREARARVQVKPWRSITRNDYDFPWAQEFSEPQGKRRAVSAENRLRLLLGALYEYARESHRLRGLLALVDPQRKQKRWEDDCPESFDGLTSNDAEGKLSYRYFFLRELAPELVSNTPFAQVSEQRFKTAVRIMGQHEVVGAHFINEPLVRPAEDYLLPVASTFETLAGITELVEDEQTGDMHERPRYRQWMKDSTGNDCSEAIAIVINWRDASDKDLATAFKDFCATYRPKEQFPGHGRKGKGSAPSLTRALDALSAMRLANEYRPEKPHDATKELSAIEEFTKIRLNDCGGEIQASDFHKFRREAIETFQNFFGFGVADFPANGKTRTQMSRVAKITP